MWLADDRQDILKNFSPREKGNLLTLEVILPGCHEFFSYATLQQYNIQYRCFGDSLFTVFFSLLNLVTLNNGCVCAMKKSTRNLLIFMYSCVIAIVIVALFFTSRWVSAHFFTQSQKYIVSPTAIHHPGNIPGQQQWKGVSSLLFGANDASWNWSSHNMGNNPAIRATVKAAGIPLIRTPLTRTDALKRVSAIEQAGALCLGILHPEDAVQVVQMLGTRCKLYEWENEPDNNGEEVSHYAQSWNQFIPRLRTINQQAVFIGPAVSFANISYIQKFLELVQKEQNLPDVVSYHMYPCTDQTTATCSQHIHDFVDTAEQIKKTMMQVLAKNLPLAITEWNYSWKNYQTPYNQSFMQEFTDASLKAMIQAGIAIANQFDIASNAGYGTLDMINPTTGEAYPQMVAMRTFIAQYKKGS